MRPVITAWSAISPFGYGREAFADGLLAGRAAHEVPRFVIAEQLGAKGTGSMDRSSALAVATAGLLLKEAGVRTGPATGVVLGTTSGSTRTQFEFTRESLVRRKPYLVNPAVMPYALMNSAAAQCAIRHRLTGPNTTVANGRMSLLAGLRYATRLLTTGRASGLLCGAVEEHAAERELLEQPGGAGPLGEGCAMVFLEPAGTEGGRAELAAVDTRLALDGSPRRALSASLRAALGAAGAPPEGVAAVALSCAGGESLDAERAAVAEVLGRAPERVVNPAALTGDTGAVTGAFQLAALLSLPEQVDWAVLTCVGRDTTAGCAVFRLLRTGVAG
jgi:3-oxoacyl-[acyl-carrier-protein] synthase II